jgi:hypothetical protein
MIDYMKKKFLIGLFIFSMLLFVLENKAYAKVEESEYSIVSVSKDNLVVKNITILGGSYGGSNFWVGDPLSFYPTYFLVEIGGELSWSLQAVWENSDYIVKEGYQEVALTLSYPANVTIVLGITGNTYQSTTPTPVPTITDTTNEIDLSDEEINPTLSKSAINIKPKVKYQLEIEDLPEGYTVAFVSSNKKVATVGLKGGVITGRIKGKATVRCIITAPNGDKITLKCSVVVK